MDLKSAKIIIVILVAIIAVLVALIVIPSAAFGAFSDVPATHPHAAAITALQEASLVAGYGDGTFQPDKSVSRAESLAMILKAAGIQSGTSTQKIPFTDVPETAWYFPMVQKGVALEKLKGYEDKTFRPENPVTLPEALALTLSFFQMSVKDIAIENVLYEGLDTAQWYAPYAQYAKNNFLIEPDIEGRVDDLKPMTRGEVATLMHRMRIVKQTGKPFDIATDWITTEYLENFWKLRHPAEWEIFKGTKNSVIWKRGGEAFFTRVWPTSTRLSLSVVENPENISTATYFANAKIRYEKDHAPITPIFTELSLGGRPAIKIIINERRVLDHIIALPNGQFLVLHGDWGTAPAAEFLKKKLELIVASYHYVEKPAEPPKPVIPLEERMATLREKILVKDSWKLLSPLFPDTRNIHTDAIGIGTGPIDYYYSAEADHTIKLERNSGTVLNIREGRTSAF